MITKSNILSFFVLCLIAIAFASSVKSQTPCPGQWQYGHWKCGVTVYYKFDSSIPNDTSPASEMSQIDSAVAKWETENTLNNSKVHFQKITGSAPSRSITFKNGYVDGTSAAQTLPVTLPSTGELFDATITFDTSLQLSGGALFYDSSKSGYNKVFLKQTLHELGHTMGLAHYHPDDGSPYDPCTQQTRLHSVMNDGCGPNDIDPPTNLPNQPEAPTSCDRTSVNTVYPVLCQTPTPTPTPPPVPVGVCNYPVQNFNRNPCSLGYTSDQSGYYCCCSMPETSEVCTEQRLDCESQEGTWKGCCKGCFTPIVIDVAGNGFNLTDGNNGVFLDLVGDGVKNKTAWTAPGSDDAWLALDRNHNGAIDNATELFGNFTEQPDSIPVKDRNGFYALAVFDQPQNGGNGDGKINRQDRIYNDLRLWQDTNHNGVSEPNELQTMDALDIRAILLDFQLSRRTDEFGNRFKYKARVRDRRDADVGKFAWDVIPVKPR